MQDEVRDKSVAFVVQVGKTGAKMTERLLKMAIREYLKQTDNTVHGKQSVKNLVRQDAGVQNIEITNGNIKSFERVARKYGVDFALKKEPKQGKYLVFFKARDADALNAAFSEYAAKTLKKTKEKPSVIKQLSHFKEAVHKMADNREKKQNRGGHEL